MKKYLRLLLLIPCLLPLSPFAYSQTLDSPYYPLKWHQRKSFQIAAVPVALSMIGLSTLITEDHTLLSKYNFQEEIRGEGNELKTKIDDHFRNAPVALVYGLNLIGVKGKNNFVERTAILAKSMLIQHALVSMMKRGFNVERPNGGDFSFPSSHTARAFATATFMHREYKDVNIWYSVSAYSFAATTGMLRMKNNHHWLPDVLIGAGIGILSTNIAYATHQYKWTKWFYKQDKNKEMVILPSYSGDASGLYFSYKFK